MDACLLRKNDYICRQINKICQMFMSVGGFKATEEFHGDFLQNECSNDMKCLLECISRLSDLCFLVIDFSDRKIVYRSKNLLFVDLALKSDVQRENYNPFWSLMDQDDYNLMMEVEKAYEKFVRELKNDEKRKHTLVLNYHIWFRKQKQVVTQKFTPLRMRSDGSLWLGIFMMTISPNNSCRQIVVLGESFKYLYDLGKRKFLPYNEFVGLTLLEKAILLKTAEGLSTKKIASDLYKSVNTIKTHKERLFAKLNVNSMNEALALISSYNLFFEE